LTPDRRVFIAAILEGRDRALGAISSAERLRLEELCQPEYAPLWFDVAAGLQTRRRFRRRV